MGRGRPAIDDTPPPRQYVKQYNNWDGSAETWHYNLDKFPNGAFKVETTPVKGVKSPKVMVEKNKPYAKMPVAMVFKTSNRSNAKTKMKVWKNTNIDHILSSPKLPGVPENAVILQLGVGESMVKEYKRNYNL